MTDGRFTHIPMVSPKTGAPPTQAVLMLHGYGSNGTDFLSLASYWAAGLPNTVFIGPDAPFVCEISSFGFQWFSMEEIRQDSSQASALRRTGADRVVPVLDALIGDLLARFALPPSKLALVGFSQGTMMALHVALRRPLPLAGVLGYSGMLIDPPSLTGELKAKPPVLLIHGDADLVVPYDCLLQAEAALGAAGVAVKTLACPGLDHSIDEAGLEAGQRFLQQCLGG